MEANSEEENEQYPSQNTASGVSILISGVDLSFVVKLSTFKSVDFKKDGFNCNIVVDP